MEKGKTMKDNDMCASMDYEAEYKRTSVKLAKATDENHYLREELKNKEREMNWYYGFKAAIEMVFGRGGCNG
jgi:hypothetical protein